MKPLITGLENVSGVTVNNMNKKLYFCNNNEIWSSDFAGTNITVERTNTCCDYLAVDGLLQALYVTCGEEGKLSSVIKFDISDMEAVPGVTVAATGMKSDMKYPHMIALRTDGIPLSGSPVSMDCALCMGPRGGVRLHIT